MKCDYDSVSKEHLHIFKFAIKLKKLMCKYSELIKTSVFTN